MINKCPRCKGKGYIQNVGMYVACYACGGTGQRNHTIVDPDTGKHLLRVCLCDDCIRFRDTAITEAIKRRNVEEKNAKYPEFWGIPSK